MEGQGVVICYLQTPLPKTPHSIFPILELFREFFGAVRAILGLYESLLAPHSCPNPLSCSSGFYFSDVIRVTQEPETGTAGTVFARTERRTGTAGTVFQEPKPEPEPSSR